MSPQEKAEELVWKYSRALQIWDEENSLKAIQCALIAVDEIIEVAECLDYEFGDDLFFWQEVKQEIEKL